MEFCMGSDGECVTYLILSSELNYEPIDGIDGIQNNEGLTLVRSIRRGMRMSPGPYNYLTDVFTGIKEK